MGRKGMDLNQFNQFMKRCEESAKVRYVKPTIHAKFKTIVAITLITSDETIDFSITNHPDENFNLDFEVNKYLDNLSKK